MVSAEVRPDVVGESRTETVARSGAPAGPFRRTWVALALPGLALLLASALIDLGDRPLWLDEGFTAGALAQQAEVFRATGGTMALYYAFVDLFADPGSSAAVLRFPSVLAVAVALPFAAAVARRAATDRLAVVTCVAIGASPFVVHYAQEARAYGLVLLMGAMSWWALTRALEAGFDSPHGRRWMLTLGAVATAGQLAHSLLAVQLPAQILVAAAVVPPSLLLKRFAPAVLGVAAMTLLTLSAGAHALAGWIPPLSGGQAADVAKALTATTVAGTVLAVCLVTWGGARSIRRATRVPVADRWRPLLLASWALAPVAMLAAISVVHPVFIARYAIASVPAILALAVTPIVDGWGSPSVARRSAAAVLAVAVAVSLAVGQVAVRSTSTGDWRAAAGTVAASTEAGDVLYFPYAGQRPAFEAAWRDVETATPPRPINPGRPLGEPRLLERFWSDARIRTALLDSERVWVVTVAAPAGQVDDVVADTLGGPVSDHFRRVARHELAGEVTVELLQSRSSR